MLRVGDLTRAMRWPYGHAGETVAWGGGPDVPLREARPVGCVMGHVLPRDGVPKRRVRDAMDVLRRYRTSTTAIYCVMRPRRWRNIAVRAGIHIQHGAAGSVGPGPHLSVQSTLVNLAVAIRLLPTSGARGAAETGNGGRLCD